jgi:hypothetical protein
VHGGPRSQGVPHDRVWQREPLQDLDQLKRRARGDDGHDMVDIELGNGLAVRARHDDMATVNVAEQRAGDDLPATPAQDGGNLITVQLPAPGHDRLTARHVDDGRPAPGEGLGDQRALVGADGVEDHDPSPGGSFKRVGAADHDAGRATGIGCGSDRVAAGRQHDVVGSGLAQQRLVGQGIAPHLDAVLGEFGRQMVDGADQAECGCLLRRAQAPA